MESRGDDQRDGGFRERWASVKTLAHVLNERRRGLMDDFDLICVVKEYLRLLHC